MGLFFFDAINFKIQDFPNNVWKIWLFMLLEKRKNFTIKNIFREILRIYK